MKLKLKCAVFLLALFFSGFARADDVVSVASYGAKCDGVTDDSAAFQNAINAAAPSRGVEFSGTCVAHDLTLATDVKSFELNGHGGTILSASNGLLFSYSGSDNHYIYVHDLKIVKSGSTGAGTGIRFEDPTNSYGIYGSVIDRVTVSGFLVNIDLRNVAVSRVINSQSFCLGNASCIGIYIHGDSSSGNLWSTNNIISNNFLTTGNCIEIQGAVQGVVLSGNQALQCVYGLHAHNGDLMEAITSTGNYYEGSSGGFVTEDVNFVNSVNDTADINGTSVNSGWHAFSALGWGNVGIKFTADNVFGISAATGAPYHIEGIQVHFANNTATGPANAGINCMEFAPAPQGAQFMVDGNSCLNAGSYSTATTGPLYAVNNFYTTSSGNKVWSVGP